MASFLDCQGNRHNQYVFAGPYDECGRVDVFGIWKEQVNEKKAKPSVQQFRELYDIPLHDCPNAILKDVNMFYQGKYGMFTCHDTLQRMGEVRYGEDLIEHWQKSKEDRELTWNLAIVYVVTSGKAPWSVLESYKKNYRESKPYLSYVQKNSDH